MAEESGQEKTEDPTPKRLRDAREKGDIPRSRELNSTALLMAAAAAMLIFGKSAVDRILNMVASHLDIPRADIFDSALMIAQLVDAMRESIYALMGFMGFVLLAALLAPVALGGWNFSGQAIMPKGSRLNPGAGIKRMFSVKALVELAKAIGKFLVVLAFAVFVLMALQGEIFGLASQDVNLAIAHATEMIAWAFLIMSSSLILISAIDVPYQLHDYSQKLKMTMQEVKDEMKNTEGKPEVKGRIRQLQREIAQRQMMKNVPEADVVITNPTHYAVALKYVSDERAAPIMVAKGADFVALKIREIAKEHEIPILEAPALSRALYYNGELDQEIPVGLYKAVAQVLAYVFQLKRFRENSSEARPIAPRVNEMEIPPEYRVSEPSDDQE
jgi:flagellar biosynthetic protein FlhB